MPRSELTPRERLGCLVAMAYVVAMFSVLALATRWLHLPERYFFAVLAGMLSAPAFIARCVIWYVRRRRPPAGHCQKCGYDLKGNVTGRCPECGDVFALLVICGECSNHVWLYPQLRNVIQSCPHCGRHARPPLQPAPSAETQNRASPRMRLLAETAWWDLCMAGTVTVGCVLALIFGLSFAFDRLGLPHEFLVPTAFLALLVPVVFMGFFKRLRKRPRYSAGHCRVCGYNLTGNVTGICPECGTSFGLGVICECCEKMVYFHPDKQGTFQTCPHCGDVSEVPRMPSAADRSSEQSPPTTPP